MTAHLLLRILRSVLVASALLVLTAPYAEAQIPLNTTNANLRAKAAPDECFLAIGLNLPFTKPPCLFSQPKVNQAYVWGMTQTDTDIWFGTIANPQCITQGGLFPPSSLIPYQTDSWVCEFDKSPYVPFGIPGVIGDFRPPRMYVYNKATKVLTDVTPTLPGAPFDVDTAVLLTRGIRAAGTIGNLILFAGPALAPGTLNFFAFRADTKQYLGTYSLPGYDNIRQMLTYDGQLYLPVGTTGVGGKVLRWNGSISAAPCASCFSFETVGNIDGIGAYIAAHEGRLFVTTWPTGTATSVSTLMMSPVVPAGGLTALNAPGWRKIWDARMYEPDPAIAIAYAGGALASFDGQLYWGTMHVPWLATAVALTAYQMAAPTNDQETAELVIGTFRTATMFRARNFGNPVPDIDLLYGWPGLFSYKPGIPKGKWEIVDNKMPAGKKVPLYGPPGFGNYYNTYTWSMAVWDNRLWVGTMDWSRDAEQGTKAIYKALSMPQPPEIGAFFALQNFGADLFFFQSAASPAVPENQYGLGNVGSFGVRNMVANAPSLYVGIANASNLLTSPFGPLGGWELLELQKKPGVGPLNLLTQFTCAPTTLTGPGNLGCVAKTSAASTGAGITVGVFPVAVDVKVTAPPLVDVPAGLNTVAFPIQVGEVAKPTPLYLVAGLNGGTMVASAQLLPGIPRLTAQVTSQGRNPSNQLYVDLLITNTGNGTAKVAQLTNIVPRTLIGTGTVTYAVGPGLSAALPSNLGSIPPGQTATVRLWFNVPATVTRFALTEVGAVTSLAGTNYNFSLAQSIVP